MVRREAFTNCEDVAGIKELFALAFVKEAADTQWWRNMRLSPHVNVVRLNN